jgi:hypothetical protein
MRHNTNSTFLSNKCSTFVFFYNLKKKMLVIFLVFSWYSLNCDMAFKITNRLKINNDNFKFNGNFKCYITVGRTLEEHLTFPLKKNKIKNEKNVYNKSIYFWSIFSFFIYFLKNKKWYFSS